MRLLPVLLYNSGVREYDNIQYPRGMPPHPALPVNRAGISAMTGMSGSMSLSASVTNTHSK